MLTNKERALSGGEGEYHFGHIDEVSKEVSENDGDAPARLERAVDYYLVQDVEAAMGDADKAVSALGDSWVPFFIRAFVRYKQLELARMNAAESLDVSSIWIHRAKEEFESDFGKKILADLGIEGDYEGIGHCALGYAAEPAKAPAPRKENYVYYVR